MSARRRGGAVAAALFCALALIAGCGQSKSAEEQIRELFERTAAAVQARDVEGALESVSESYRDLRGHDKAAIGQLLRLRLRLDGSVYLLWKARRIEVDGSSATATVVVAAAARPVDATSLRDVDADLLRFEVALREERGAWRIASAEWEPASLAELL